MARGIRQSPAKKNGRRPKEQRMWELDREIQKFREKYAASGGKFLNRQELDREIAERRGLE